MKKLLLLLMMAFSLQLASAQDEKAGEKRGIERFESFATAVNLEDNQVEKVKNLFITVEIKREYITSNAQMSDAQKQEGYQKNEEALQKHLSTILTADQMAIARKKLKS